MSTSSVETSPVPDAPPASASVQSGPSDTSNSAAAPPQGSVVSNSDSAEISATALHGAVDRQRQVAYNVLKRVTCTFIIVTPIVAVPFLDDGVNAASTLTEVVVPIAGSFVFLLLIASFLTFGGRLLRRCVWNMDDTCEDSASVQRERAAIAALKALPLRTLVAGDPELAEGAEDECALCLSDVVAGDVMRVLPCRHSFHRDCVDRWLIDSQAYQTRECPVCKADPIPARGCEKEVARPRRPETATHEEQGDVGASAV